MLMIEKKSQSTARLLKLPLEMPAVLRKPCEICVFGRRKVEEYDTKREAEKERKVKEVFFGGPNESS